MDGAAGEPAGVVGPKSLALSAGVADGTILPEGRGPDDVARLRALIDAAIGPTDPPRAADRHRLTVFTGFYCGDLSLLPPPPEHLPEGWAAVGPTPEAVADELSAATEVWPLLG